MRIAILYICTGKYTVFWKNFYLSCEKYFISESEKHYFVFTDSADIDFEKENPNIHRIFQENLGWPNNTLKRYEMFLCVEDKLSQFDYIFFFNSNLLLLKPITTEEFLPNEKENLVACLHPGYFNKKRKEFTYDENERSSAFIAKNEGVRYFAGGINGGKTSSFIEAIEKMNESIKKDSKNNVTAKWHDESHWNKYLSKRNDIKVLSPSYLYPEYSNIPFEPKILIRDKRNYGGFAKLRGNFNLRLFLETIKFKLTRYLRSISE